MKMLIISTIYELYLKKLYGGRPELREKPYNEQKAALDYDAFGWVDSWSHVLRPLGYEATEVIANAGLAQRAWAKEHGVRFRESNWLLDIAMARAERERPEVLFMCDYSTFTYRWLKELRERCPSIMLVVGWCGAPFTDSTVFEAYDIVLSCVPELVERFRGMGHRAAHLNHAFDPRVLGRIREGFEPSIDLSFIGSIVRSGEYHLGREQILERVAGEIEIKIFSPSAESTLADGLKMVVAQGVYSVVAGLRAIGVPNMVLKGIPVLGRFAHFRSRPMRSSGPASGLRSHMRPSVFGLEMYQSLRDSKVTLNSHIDISPKSASNMRLFEATGVGTCLLTDWKENIHELFEPEKEVITYRTAEECVEKAKWLLEHPEEREKIAKAGQARCLRDHTFYRRAFVLDEIIKREIARV